MPAPGSANGFPAGHAFGRKNHRRNSSRGLADRRNSAYHEGMAMP